jgi:hypothetical protein
MAGWDSTKWGSQEHQTPKYVVGRILSQFQPSIEGLSQAMQQIQQAYPGAQFNGKDKVTIPGVGEFDVLTNSGSGTNMGWAWQDLSAPGGPAPGGFGPSPTVAPGPTVPSGPSAAVQQAISSVGNLPTYTPYQFQNFNAPTYQPGQISQFQAPNLSQFESGPQGQDALIQSLLANPESMGADTVNQMRATQSEASARMLQDAIQRMGQSAVSRGALGGLLGGERRLNQAAMSDLLGKFRDIDIEAAKTNFADRLNVLGASDSALNNRMGRATQGYGATLAGEQTREEAARAAIQSALQNAQFGFQQDLAKADEARFGYGSQADAMKFELQKALGLGGLDIQNRGLGLEGSRLAEQIRQFNTTFPESQRQFNAQMGFNWGSLGASQQQALINSLLR